MKRFCTTVGLVGLLWFPLHGQASLVIDSLRQILPQQTQPEDQHRVLMQLATVFGRISLDSSRRYAHEARTLAHNHTMPLWQAQAEGLIAYVFLYEGNLDSAEVHYASARTSYGAISDTLGIVQSEMNLASLDYYRGNYQQGIEKLLEALRMSNLQPKGEGRRKNRASILNNLGVYYDAWNEDSMALVYFHQALTLKRLISAEDPAQVNFDLPVARTLNNMGGAYAALGQYDSAKVCFDESLGIHLSEGDDTGLARTYQALAELYIVQEDYDKAESYQEQVWSLDQRTGEKTSLTSDMQNWATIRKGQGRLEEAKDWALRSLALSREIGVPHDEVVSLKLLGRITEELQQWREAVGYWNAHRTLSDSLFNEEFKEETARLTQLYETERKDNEIFRLTQDAEIRELTLTRRNQQLLFVVILASLLIALAFLIYTQYQQKRRSEKLLSEKNEQLRELNAMKDKLFSIVAHDLRNPLSALQSLTSSLEQQVFDLSREEIQRFLQQMQNSSFRLYDLLQNLLQWAMSQTGRLNFDPRIQRLSKIWERVLRPLQAEIEAKQLVVSTTFDKTAMIWADRAMLDIILRNVFSNAIKFSPQGGEITLAAEDTDTGIWLSIADRGVGLSEEDAARLFAPDTDMREVGDHPAKGTGLGLQLSHELIQRHGGTIAARPSTEGGAVFTLFFPHEDA